MATLYDFANPVMVAAIVNPDDTRIPLWSNSYVDGELPPLPVLQDLSIQLLLNNFPIITATLAGPYEYMIRLLNDEKIQYGSSHIQVQFGYALSSGAAVLSPVFTGLLTTPDVSISAEEVTIGLVSQPVLGFSATRTTAPNHYYHRSRLQIIKSLLAGPDPDNPRKIDVNTDAVEAGGFATDAQKLLLLDRQPTFSAGYLTEWTLIQRLIKESKCWFTFEQQELGSALLRIFPVDTQWISEPGWRFQLFPGDITEEISTGGGIGPATGVYPILTFNTPTQAVFYPASILGAHSAGIDDKTGEVVHNSFADKDKFGGKPVNRSGPGTARGKKGAFQEPDKKNGAAMDIFHSDNPNAKKHAEKVHAEIGSMTKNGGARIEVETLGVPDLLPGRTAQIDGMGPRFDWNYGIYEVVHTLGSSGFSTQWVGYYNSAFVQGEVIKAFGLVENPPAKAGEEGASTDGGSGT